MDKNELERRLEAAEKQNLGLLDEIKNLKAKLAEMQDEPKIPDFPVYSVEPLYFMDSRFRIVGDESSICSGNMYDDFNAFHTKEMAQEFVKKCKLIAMMLHCKWYLDRDYVPNWKNREEHKYLVCFDHVDGCFKYGLDHSLDGGSISFGTDGAARKCAEWLNKHWKENDNG